MTMNWIRSWKFLLYMFLFSLASTAGPDDESDMDSEDSEYVPLDEWKKVGLKRRLSVPS